MNLVEKLKRATRINSYSDQPRVLSTWIDINEVFHMQISDKEVESLKKHFNHKEIKEVIQKLNSAVDLFKA